MKFKPGMKVKAIDDQEEYRIKGLVGKVVVGHWMEDYVGVEFKQGIFTDGHDLDGNLGIRADNGLWVDVKHLKPLILQLENK